MERVYKLALPETARGLEDRADVQRPLTELHSFHGETSNIPSADELDPINWIEFEHDEPWTAMRPQTPEFEGGVEYRADFQRQRTEVLCFHGETSNSPSAHGQHTNNGVEVEKMPTPGRRNMRSKRAVAQTGGKPLRGKRPRAANYTDDEKNMVLLAKLRSAVEKLESSLRASNLRPLGVSTSKNDKSWAYHASEGGRRDPKSYQQQWDSLLKLYNPIRDHELKIIAGIAGIHNSYWQLTEDQPQMDEVNEERQLHNLQVLPRGFKRKWYESIELIYQLQDAAKKISSWKEMFPKSSGKVEANLRSPSTAHIASTITNSNISPGGPLDATRSQPSSSKEVQESMDPPEPLVSDQDQNRAEVDVVQGESHNAYISMEAPRIEEAPEPHCDSVLRIQELGTQQSVDIVEQDLPLKSDTLALEHKKVARKDEKLVLKREELAFKREELAFKRDKLAWKREKQAREKPVKLAS